MAAGADSSICTLISEKVLSYLGLLGCLKVLIKLHHLFVVIMRELYQIVTPPSSYILLTEVLYPENGHYADFIIGYRRAEEERN
jgi:hypothetical protein